jgi:retron-type reverse transcriptase
MKRYGNLFERICDLENLHNAYNICLRGKRLKRDVLGFTFNLSHNLLALQQALKSKTYEVSDYFSFHVFEPKKRLIQALPFRDRVVQQALCLIISPLIEKSFIFDTYACIKNKGTHAGSNRLQHFLKKAQDQWARPYCLKCDIASYFNSINHKILLELFEHKIKCKDTLWLIEKITNSNNEETGIPIGNLLSQLSANLYLDVLDGHIKHKCKITYYLRYMDDFCILHSNKIYLKHLKDEIALFLEENLKLRFNNRTDIFPVSQGIDFLGYRTWETHRLLRNKSKNRMRRKLRKYRKLYSEDNIKLSDVNASIQSWLGHCKHANTYRLREKMLSDVIFTKKIN